jgi:hypothetical protein
MSAGSPWITLRVQGGAGDLRIEYSDSTGYGFEISADPAMPTSNVGERNVEVLSRDDARSRLRERIGKVYVYGARPLPMFVESILSAPAEVLKATRGGLSPLDELDRFVQGVEGVSEKIQVVQLAPGPWPSPPPFRLPLDVLTVGSASAALRDAINSRDWLAEIQTADAGLVTTDHWVRELVKRTASDRETDMLICAGADLGKIAPVLRLARHRPRLVVGLVEVASASEAIPLPRGRLPSGSSLLLLPFGGNLGSASAAIVELMRDWAHDRQLHELGRRLNKDDMSRARPSVLASRPEALDALRLSQAILEVNREILALRKSGTEAGLDKLKYRLDRLPRPRLQYDRQGQAASRLRRALRIDQPRVSIDLENVERDLRSSVPSIDIGGAYYESTLNQIRHFQRETDALLPITKVRRQIVEDRAAEADIQDAVEEALAQPALREVLLAEQARTVDITMERDFGAKRAAQFLTSADYLIARQKYRMRVQVGRRSSVSLVVGDVPPIDLLLPPPKRGRRHVLSVAFYTQDFDLGKTPPMQRLELPELGASDPLYFDVVPRQNLESAKARIAVYYELPPDAPTEQFRNHLIQTFLLTAAVRQGEDIWSESTGVKVELDFSINSRFDELETLKPRMLSLALNDGAAPASHMLAVKRSDTGLPVFFTEIELTVALKQIRADLTWATIDDEKGEPRFPDDRGEEGNFDEALRRLAKAGSNLYNELFARALNTGLEPALNAARKANDQIIQAVHLAENFAFPWNALYDFDLPEQVHQGPPLPVCKGFTRSKPDGTLYSCADCLKDCQHAVKKEAVCAYGFWGLRHQVEQLITTRLTKPRELQPIADVAVRYVVGLPGTQLDRIPGDLASKLGSSVRPIPDDQEILPLLWGPDRPPVLLIVGHYKTAPVLDEREGPRITLPRARFLTPDDILNQRKQNPDPWGDPRSVVLLAACRGGVVDIRGVRNFVNMFTQVGAGAVIGPDAVIYEGLARSFATRMCDALVNERQSVGSAVLEFRRYLLRNFNPLGLVFTTYGFADLASPSVAKPAAPVTETAAASP